MIKNLTCILALFSCLNLYGQNLNIAPTIIEKMSIAQSNDKISCFIKLKNQADLSTARKLKTKQEKGIYVFNTLQNVAKNSQASIIDYLQNEDIKYQAYYIVNAIYIEANKSQIEFLATLDLVESIIGNSNFVAPQIQTEKPIIKSSNFEQKANINFDNITWGLETIKANILWEAGYLGEGIVIGGQDTGYEYLHPSIQKKYRGYGLDNYNHNYNWHDAIHAQHPLNSDNNNPCGYSTLHPCDDDTHGTHTMGTMVGGQSPISNIKIGVAPKAKWIGCRNMDRGWGSAQSYMECFEWFLAPTDLNNNNPNPDLAPHVIANSWGCPPIEGCDSSSIALMNIVVNNLVDAGIFVVVSAGNDGPDCNTINTPAPIFNASFVVGASNELDSIAGFSSRGLVNILDNIEMKPNVVAPGVNILSSIYNNWEASYQGTSMAGPHVAGAVALLISAKPSLAGQVDSIKSILQNTAKPIYVAQTCDNISGTTHPNPVAGYGRIDMVAALNSLNIHTGIPYPLSQKNLHIYPNPAKENLNIALVENTQNFLLEIHNTLGQNIYSQYIENQSNIFTLDIANLLKGFYFISLTNNENNTIYQGKFIKY